MKKVDFDNEFKNPGSEYRSIPFLKVNRSQEPMSPPDAA